MTQKFAQIGSKAIHEQLQKQMTYPPFTFVQIRQSQDSRITHQLFESTKSSFHRKCGTRMQVRQTRKLTLDLSVWRKLKNNPNINRACFFRRRVASFLSNIFAGWKSES